MTFSIADILFYFLLSMHVLFATISLFNALFAPRIRRCARTDTGGLSVALLIPARNEEENLRQCLQSVLAQTYAPLSVIVCDDNSTDTTPEIIGEYHQADPRVRGIRGAPLPDGWTGKNWACHQLYEAADAADCFLFMDADCVIAPGAVEAAVTMMRKYGLDLLSCFPTQAMVTRGERLVVPLMNWLLLTFLPLRLVYLSRWKSFVAANGQFMCFTRSLYEGIGGHQSVRDRVVEDMELARAVKRSGHRMMTALGADLVHCRMYRSFSSSLEGFAKNLYAGFNASKFSFTLLLSFFFLCFAAVFFIPLCGTRMLTIPALVLFQRAMVSAASRQDIVLNWLMHLPQMVLLVHIGIKAMKGRIQWKGRNI